MVSTPPELEYIKTKAVEEVSLPDNDDNSVLTACRKPSNVNRFYDRTAGVMALMRPCGIIVNFAEMYTCESPTQCYVFIYTTFGRTLDDLSRLKYLGYDRTCDLHPFLRNLANLWGPRFCLKMSSLWSICGTAINTKKQRACHQKTRNVCITLTFPRFRKSTALTPSVLNKLSSGLASSSSCREE